MMAERALSSANQLRLETKHTGPHWLVQQVTAKMREQEALIRLLQAENERLRAKLAEEEAGLLTWWESRAHHWKTENAALGQRLAATEAVLCAALDALEATGSEP